jgi:hypothetical protein
MPEGRAERGRSRRRKAKSIDGAEPRASVSPVMAGDHGPRSAGARLEVWRGAPVETLSGLRARPLSGPSFGPTCAEPIPVLRAARPRPPVERLARRHHGHGHHGVNDPADPRVGSGPRARGGVVHAITPLLFPHSRTVAGGSTRRPISRVFTAS